MEYNVCKYCGAKDGRAGFLVSSPHLNIEMACKNCYDTLATGKITITTHLNRTPEELDKTIHLLDKNNIMNRFFGMMPSREVKIRKTFVDGLGLKIRIEAGENGWTIIYADNSSEYKDETNTAEKNFDRAFQVLTSHFMDIKEFDDDSNSCSEEC